MSLKQTKQLSIKFSHIYPKLLDSHNRPIQEATLLEVLSVDIENLHLPFLTYDTTTIKNSKYKLPEKGKFLLLIFLKSVDSKNTRSWNLFTTIRRYTPKKHKYYVSNIGKTFKIIIQDADIKEK